MTPAVAAAATATARDAHGYVGPMRPTDISGSGTFNKAPIIPLDHFSNVCSSKL